MFQLIENENKSLVSDLNPFDDYHEKMKNLPYQSDIYLDKNTSG